MKFLSLFSALLLAVNVAQPQAPRQSVSPNASATLSAPTSHSQRATPAGTHTFPVLITSGGASMTVNLQLTVQ